MENKADRLKVINRDLIKYIIIFVMFWGHLFAWVAIDESESGLFAGLPWWQWLSVHLSLLAPPVMFFFVADGFRYTRSPKKYALRLLIFALVTQIPSWLLWVPILGWWNSNVGFTLFFGLLSLIAWESKLKLPWRIILVILCDLATVALMSDWMIFGVPIIFGLHVFRDKPKIRFAWYSALWAIVKIVAFIGFLGDGTLWKAAAATVVGIFDFLFAYFLMTKCYNGKKGKHPEFAKWFFYVFYPLHILLIYGIRVLVN